MRKFLQFLNIEITSTALSELIQRKKNNPKDYFIDDKIEEFANLEPISSHRRQASTILGIFRANRQPLVAKVDTHISTKPTRPISEGILKAIYKSLTKEHQLLMQYQAYSGQRIQALARLPTEQEAINIGNYTALLILSKQNKSRLTHYTIIPTKTYQQIQAVAKKRKTTTYFPNYRRLWREITRHAKQKYNINLTSHYLRKRFFSIAEKTPMAVNHWDYLMGSKPRQGHCASHYSLNDLQELVTEYHTYLSHALALNNDHSNVESDHLSESNNQNYTPDHTTYTLRHDTEQPSNLLHAILTELQKLNKNVEALRHQYKYQTN